MSHLRITQAGAVAAATTIIGQLVAFVPAFAPDKQVLISAASAVISAAFLLANAVHKLADSNVSARDVETGAIAAARREVGNVNFTSLVQQAVDAKSIPDLEAKVATEVQAAIGRLFNQAASGPSVAPAAVIPVRPVDPAAGPPPAA